MIPEKATIIPQYQHASMETEYPQPYENTLPGVTNIATPIAQSTPVTQSSYIPVVGTGTGRDILQPISSEGARAKYLEEQMKNMSGMKLPLKSSLIDEEMLTSADLTRKIDLFCKEQTEKRRIEREAHEMILDAFAKGKGKQAIPPRKEEMQNATIEDDVIIEYITDAQGRRVKKLKPILIKSEPDREHVHHIHSDDNLPSVSEDKFTQKREITIISYSKTISSESSSDDRTLTAKTEDTSTSMEDHLETCTDVNKKENNVTEIETTLHQIASSLQNTAGAYLTLASHINRLGPSEIPQVVSQIPPPPIHIPMAIR